MLIVALGLVAFTTLAICLAAEPLGRWLRVVDEPDGVRKLHSKPTPLIGGLAVALPFAGTVAAWGFADGPVVNFSVMALAVVCFFVLGFADDRWQLRPSHRLIIGVLLCAAGINVAPELSVTELTFSFVEGTYSIANWHIPFNIIVLIGFVFAFNMSDGLNGLSLGQCLIWGAFFLLFSSDHTFPIFLSFLIVVAVVFVFNVRGKLFLGDSGTYALAITVGLSAIYCYSEQARPLEADLVALWLLIPVVDCVRLIVSRVMRGASPLSADRDHLHHRVARIVGEPWVQVIYLGLVGAPGLFAILVPGLTMLWLAMSMIIYSGLLIWGHRRRCAEIESG